MGSTKSSLKTKFHVHRQPLPGRSEDVELENPLQGGWRLKFVDRQLYEDLETKSDDMKRSAGPSDKAFIDDLLNSRFIEPELSAAIIQEHVKRVVDARKAFYQQMQAAQDSIKALDSSQCQEEMFHEESDVDQWLTESATSDSNAQASDVKETPRIKSGTVHTS